MLANGRLIGTLEGHTKTIHALAVSPDGKSLASAATDGQIRIWDLHERQLVHTLTGHTNWVLGLAFHPDRHASRLGRGRPGGAALGPRPRPADPQPAGPPRPRARRGVQPRWLAPGVRVGRRRRQALADRAAIVRSRRQVVFEDYPAIPKKGGLALASRVHYKLGGDQREGAKANVQRSGQGIAPGSGG